MNGLTDLLFDLEQIQIWWEEDLFWVGNSLYGDLKMDVEKKMWFEIRNGKLLMWKIGLLYDLEMNFERKKCLECEK